MNPEGVELALAAIREWVTRLPQGAADVEVSRDVPSEDEVLVDITPRRHKDASSIWILLPGMSRDMTFGAGEDFRLEGCEISDLLELCQGVASGGFVERILSRQGRTVGTRGCITVGDNVKPICEAGNLGCLPTVLLRVLGVREVLVRYPPY